MELSNAELLASWSEVEGDGEPSMCRRSCSAGQWWAVAPLRRFWRAEEVKGKAEHVRRQQGILHFKPASARHGQAKPGAWQPRGGHPLTSVGHDRSEARVSEIIHPD